MSRTTSFTSRIIASSADLAVFPAGAVFSTPATRGAKVWPLASPGQWVFMNADTTLSTGTTATPATVQNLKIGVAMDENGDGISDYIRWFNDGIRGCQAARDLRGRESNCGLGAIQDIFFGCVECGITYTIEIQVYDPITEAFGYPGRGYSYTFSYTPPCSSCDGGDCPDTTISADQVMCGLYNTIKGIHVDPNWDLKLNNFPIPRDHTYRFDVAKLYNANGVLPTTFEYCISETSGLCDDCNNLTDIGGYNLNVGEGEDVAFSPVTWITESATKYSRRGLLESAVEQLNVALGGNGSAVLLPAVGNCCTNHKIEVNTCLTGFELNDGDGVLIATCATSNPFTEVDIANECQDCDNADTTRTFTAGLRFYSIPVEGECDCIPGSRTLPQYFHEIAVYPKLGFEINGGVYVQVRQTATLPEGQGFSWVSKELSFLENGDTEPFIYGNYGGKYGLSVKSNDILAQTTTNCDLAYCSIQWLLQQKTDHTVAGTTRYFPQTDIALIPTNHTVAKASFLTAINNYLAGECGVAAVTCEV